MGFCIYMLIRERHGREKTKQTNKQTKTVCFSLTAEIVHASFTRGLQLKSKYLPRGKTCAKSFFF